VAVTVSSEPHLSRVAVLHGTRRLLQLDLGTADFPINMASETAVKRRNDVHLVGDKTQLLTIASVSNLRGSGPLTHAMERSAIGP